MTRRRHLALTAALLAALAGCATSPTSGVTTTPAVADTGPRGVITVLAAASLTEAFEAIGADLERAHPATTVRFSYGGSAALATQITGGAPADVFASASPSTMATVVAADAARTSTTFARNVMQIAVPKANPARVSGLADLARPDVKVALCQPEVPCGAAAAQVLDKAGLTVHPVTLEADVKATLAKVTLGEVDAAVVYVTDVRAAGSTVTGVEILADVNASTSYPIAVLTRGANPELARLFVAEVLSPAGQRVLAARGFSPP